MTFRISVSFRSLSRRPAFGAARAPGCRSQAIDLDNGVKTDVGVVGDELAGEAESLGPMRTDENQIRTLIEQWAAAMHRGDMERVLADHADDIVMFDVPPPYEGVRGINAYRDTWPPFFEWQARGAIFEIVSLEITTGDDVAYAHALLRCGTQAELADNPANRLRLTLGLRKEQGRWVVAHEHHSFPYVRDAG
jgi:uncharacterized protein (TIGR02246 family)